MISYFILVLQFICLSYWLGGTIVLLMIVAPRLFEISPISKASEIVSPIMRRYTGALVVILIFFVLLLSLQLTFLSSSVSLKLRLALSLSGLATVLTVYNRYTIIPNLDQFRTKLSALDDEDPQNKDALWYRRTQGRSLILLMVNLFIALGVVIILILPF